MWCGCFVGVEVVGEVGSVEVDVVFDYFDVYWVGFQWCLVGVDLMLVIVYCVYEMIGCLFVGVVVWFVYGLVCCVGFFVFFWCGFFYYYGVYVGFVVDVEDQCVVLDEVVCWQV